MGFLAFLTGCTNLLLGSIRMMVTIILACLVPTRYLFQANLCTPTTSPTFIAVETMLERIKHLDKVFLSILQFLNQFVNVPVIEGIYYSIFEVDKSISSPCSSNLLPGILTFGFVPSVLACLFLWGTTDINPAILFITRRIKSININNALPSLTDTGLRGFEVRETMKPCCTCVDRASLFIMGNS